MKQALEKDIVHEGLGLYGEELWTPSADKCSQAISSHLTSPVCSEKRLVNFLNFFEFFLVWIFHFIEGRIGCYREKPNSSGFCLNGVWAGTGRLGTWTIPPQVCFYHLVFAHGFNVNFCDFSQPFLVVGWILLSLQQQLQPSGSVDNESWRLFLLHWNTASMIRWRWWVVIRSVG